MLRIVVQTPGKKVKNEVVKLLKQKVEVG